MIRILLFSRHEKELATRQWFLSKLYESVPVANVEDLKTKAEQGAVDLLVSCETVSQKDACTAGAFLQKNCPAARVLALHHEAETPHLASGALAGPSALLHQVAERLQAA